MAWEKVKLGEVAEITSSKRIFANQYVDKGIPFYRQKEIIERNNKQDVSEPLFISQDLYEDIKKKYGVPCEGDLLITGVGVTLGIPYVVGKEIFYFKDGNLIWLKNFSQEVNSKFIYYYINSDVGQKAMWSRTIGAAQPALTIDLVKQYEIPKPPLATQQKIADILSAYDNLIENNQKQIKLLEEAAQRLYKQWFIDLRFPGHETTKIVDGLPEGWKKEKLVDLADVQFGYAFDGSLFNSNGIGTPIVRIRNIPDGITNDYTTENAPEEYLIENGDIVVGMDGEFHINSWSGEISYLVQRSCCFKPHNPKMKGWLLWAIHDPIKFFEKTVVGATVAHLGKKHIDTIELLTGPEKLYETFQNLFCKRQTLLNQNRKLAESRDRLLPKLMNNQMEDYCDKK